MTVEISSSDSKIPPPALWLGLAGLLPFAGTAAYSWLGNPASQAVAVFALLTYGAVILSFLGGVRWGALMRDPAALERISPLAQSVTPSLVGWVALLLPPAYGLIILIAGLSAQFLNDKMAAQVGLLPTWYGRLRVILSAGAVLSLVVALLALILRH